MKSNTLLYYNHNKYFISTRILAIVYSSIAASDSIIKTDYVMRLHCLQWKSDKEHEVRKFYGDASELLNKVEHNVGEEGKRDAIYYKIKMHTEIF